MRAAEMNRKHALALGAGGLLTASSGMLAGAADQPGDRIILNGVTIVDTHDGTLRHDMAVSVKHGKIRAIAPSARVAADRSAIVIDARGKYLVPGYNDMHAHPLGSSDPDGAMALLLANGVTGFREMAGSNAMHERRRTGTLVPVGAPELLELASETMNAGNSRTPELAVAQIADQIKRGADFIKIIDYTPAIFSTVAAECRRRNVRFIGHLNPAVDVREAAKSGMTSIEHLGPRDSILLGCSTAETALRAPLLAPPAGPVAPPAGPPGPPSPEAIARGLVNPTITAAPAEIARYQHVIDTFNETRMHDLAGQLVAEGTWLSPTLIRIRTMEVGDDAAYRNDPNLQYVPAKTKALWEEISRQFSAKFSVEQRDTLKRLYAQQVKLVKPFKLAGIHMLTGSDLGGGFVIAGFGLHHEFDLLEEAGLAPLEVLQMTTRDAATFLGRASTMGRVAVGHDANLVLLDANPLASVQNLHRVAGVMRAGTYYAAPALASMKQHVADRVASGVAYAEPLLKMCCS